MKPENKQTIWLGFAERSTGGGRVRIQIHWLRVALASLVLGTVFWGAGTYGVYWWLKNSKGYERVTYSDVVAWPVKLKKIKQEHGRFQVETGLEIARNAKSTEDLINALKFVQWGLNRNPDQMEGRAFLAQIRLQQGQVENAVQVMEDGLPFAKGPDGEAYIRDYVQLLLNTRNDHRVLALLDRILPAQPEPTNSFYQYLALAGMQSAAEVGDYERSYRLYRDYRLDRYQEAVMVASGLLDRVGQTDRSIELLRSFIERFARIQGEKIDPARKSLMLFLLKTKRYDEAASVGLQRSIAMADNPQPRIELLDVYEKQGRDADIKQLVERLLRQYGDNESAVALLAAFASRTERMDLSRRIYDTAIESNFNYATFGILFIEAHLQAGLYAQTLELCNDVTSEAPSWLRSQQNVLTAMRAIAHYGQRDVKTGEIYLAEVLSSPNLPSTLMRRMADQLEDLGYPEPARRVLLDARERFPKNEDVLSQLIELELSLGESRTITEHIDELLESRRPYYEQLGRFYEGLHSDRFLYAPQRQDRLERLQLALREADAIQKLDFSMRPIEDMKRDIEEARQANAEPVAAK